MWRGDGMVMEMLLVCVVVEGLSCGCVEVEVWTGYSIIVDSSCHRLFSLFMSTLQQGWYAVWLCMVA